MPSGAVCDYGDKSTGVEPLILEETPWTSRDTSPDASDVSGSEPADAVTVAAAVAAAGSSQISKGFDLWLTAFRRTRPQRDVIWRVGETSAPVMTSSRDVIEGTPPCSRFP